MSSIVEGYVTASAHHPQKVIKTQIEREAEAQTPETVEINPAKALITAALNELAESFGERCKLHETDENTLIIQTGKEDTPGIVVQVKGYASQEGVVTASQQEDATRVPEEGMPPVSDIPGYNTSDTDQVADVRKYNTEQYMKHSVLNPKKFG